MSQLQVIKTIDRQAEFDRLMKQGHFLVVDDFDSMRKVTTNQLRQMGATRIAEAVNGAEALKVLTRLPITAIISDWNMPVMTGLDLLMTVRSSPELFRLPFLMITAEAERSRVTQAIQVGVSELLVKPYTASRLAMRLEKALNWQLRHKQPIDPIAVSQALGIALQSVGGIKPVESKSLPLLDLDKMAASRPADTPKMAVPSQAVEHREPDKSTILVVDDTPDNLHLLSQLFKDEYRVRLAHNGEKALSICCSDNPPDLVLLDIMMPGMDGFEVARRMREHPNAESTPVIFVTAMTGDEARIKGMELGAVDFVTKPIDPNVLKPRVRNFMRYVELHKQLQADYDGMMEAARLREDVEHITRHDMKGPLAAIIGLVQGLAEDETLERQQVQQLRLVEETALQVLDMINLSAELYKIETGRFQLDAKPVKIGDILGRIVDILRAAFAGKHINMFVDCESSEERDAPQALGDAMLCYSLFQNLVKNACEAAPEDSKVMVKILDQSPLRVVIENRGAVPQEIRERFFDKFVTLGKQGGTGIGTYSAKLLAEAQGGSIELAVSDESDTTSISVILPRAAA